MDKKTLPIVVVLVLVILFYYPILEFLGLYTPTEPPPQSQQQSPPTDTFQPVTSEQHPIPVTEDLREMTKPAPTAVAELGEDTITVSTIEVTTNRYTITLSSLGGGPTSLLLRDYTYRDGELIQMLPDVIAATPDVMFAGGTFSSSSLHYKSDLQPGRYDATHDTLTLTYTYQSSDGGLILKHYRFFPDSYHYDLKLEVGNRQALGFERQYTLMWNTPLGVTEPQIDRDWKAMQAVAMQSGSRETLDDFEGNELHQSLEGYTSWVGIRSQYFAAAMIPQGRNADIAVANGLITNVSTPDGKLKERRITAGMVMPFANVDSFADSFTVFVGPMDYMLMADYNVGLEDILDVGTMPFFGMILKPFAIAILWLLPKLYSVIPNYGVVIILFALLVKLITLPLSMKQFKSMQGMKDLAPKLEEMKKKFKKDPQALQRATMKLYKENGVNPMSGCLVMLPQMPLMIAMFRVFQATILLRAAPFVWFIDDLSRGASGFTDPYIILVVFMVITQFISSMLTMSSGQQQQKMMMYMFPLVIAFLLYSLPSGLILYWTIFSLMSLLDWFLFKRNKIKNVEVKTA